MTDRLSNAIRAHSQSLDLGSGHNKFGVVSSVNPAASTARVTIQPEGALSGWLPVLSPWIGNGWGMVCLPQPGDQVLIVPQEGDIEQGIIVGACYSKRQRPPAVEAGEFWLVHKAGNYIRLGNDGVIHIGGDLRVSGDVYDRQGPLSHLRSSYNTHTHTVPNGTSGLPSPMDS